MASVPLEDVLATAELDRRPSRPPDYAGENEALRELMASYGERPEAVLTRLVEIAMARCGGDGAGLSVLGQGPDGEETLHWLAATGAFAHFQGTTAARAVSPGDVVIARRATQLMVRPGRHFAVMDHPGRAVHEEILTPFLQGREVVGTLWVVTFDEARHFDGEDRRVLESLALFAATAWQRHVAVERVSAELEARVERRTEELVSKNQELEGFTYAVSHDLRAPLRAMVSHASIVLEEEGPRVSEEGRARLERLKAAARRMAHLVDDLLSYARLGSRELRLETIDLSALAEEVAREMDPDLGTCGTSIDVEPGLVARGDPRLIGMALQNLFENACKYRKAGEALHVKFGSVVVGGERAFYVRDNGIGFDMAYGHKLFQPFERLHREEYAGTGIGLANVKRAIERHGGRVWAEGAPSGGATFYFTLP